jgi:hypothetical protein
MGWGTGREMCGLELREAKNCNRLRQRRNWEERRNLPGISEMVLVSYTIGMSISGAAYTPARFAVTADDQMALGLRLNFSRSILLYTVSHTHGYLSAKAKHTHAVCVMICVPRTALRSFR